MAEAEGKVLDFKGEDSINVSVLETFPYSGSKQKVLYESREFSAVCPFSGLPDYGTIKISYVPSDRIVELKSLKYYLISFRDVGIYQEHANSVLFKDLCSLLKPQSLVVELIYNTRGGIDTTTSVSLSDQ